MATNRIIYNLISKYSSSPRMAVKTIILSVDPDANLWQFTDVQRGTYFLWMAALFFVTVIGIIKLIAGWG